MNALLKVFFKCFSRIQYHEICDYECSLDLSLLKKWPVFLQNAYGNPTLGYSLRIFAFYVQCLTVAGDSQPSSNVSRKIRISQGPRSY